MENQTTKSKFDNYEAWVCNQFLACYPDDKFTFAEMVEHIRNNQEVEVLDYDYSEGDASEPEYSRWCPFEDWNNKEFADLLESTVKSLKNNFTIK